MGGAVIDGILLNVVGDRIQDLKDAVTVAALAEKGQSQVAGHLKRGQRVKGSQSLGRCSSHWSKCFLFVQDAVGNLKPVMGAVDAKVGRTDAHCCCLITDTGAGSEGSVEQRGKEARGADQAESGGGDHKDSTGSAVIHKGDCDTHHSGTTQDQSGGDEASGEGDDACDPSDDDCGLAFGHRSAADERSLQGRKGQNASS